MSEELVAELNNLFNYFELDSGNWPLLSVWSMGTFHTGVIPDDLYEIIIRLKEMTEESDA